MDFLPRPHRPLFHPPEITLLSLEGYTGDCFETYPEDTDERWHPRKPIEWLQCFETPTYDLIALIERWPLFAFLQAFFGKEMIRDSNFVQWKGQPQYPVLTMQDLPGLFAAVDIKKCTNLTAMQEPHFLHLYLNSSAGKPVHESASFDKITLHQFICQFACPEIRSSHIALLTTILMEMCLSSISLAGMRGPSVNSQIRTLNLATTTALYPEFRLYGWCPSDLAANFHRFNAPCLYYLLQMSHPRPDTDHLTPLLAKAEIESGLNKSAQDQDDQVKICTPQKCLAKVITDNEYTTKHAYNDCSCEFVGISSSRSLELCTILNQKAIPLIRSIDPDDDRAELSIIQAQPDTKYVAISHVWSDGLGNPKENTIPRCQLQKLSHHVRSLGSYYGEYIYFWLDTVCIPPDELCQCTCSSKSQDTSCDPPCQGLKLAQAQRISLELMRETYQNAEAVLVLDSWIYESTSQENSHLENLLRVFSSTWTRRLWTLQEGALAKSLHVQFLDQSLDVDAAIIRFQETADKIIRAGFLSPVVAAYWQLRHGTKSHQMIRGGFSCIQPLVSAALIRELSKDPQNDEETQRAIKEMQELVNTTQDFSFKDPLTDMARRLVAVASAVYHRSTSMPADEPLCLATLLDLDVGRIAALSSAEDRMLEFWRMFSMHMVPRKIPFLDEPKINAPGFRWASRSLLRSTQRFLRRPYDERDLSAWPGRDMELVKVTENGHLRMRAKGLILPIESDAIFMNFVLSLPDSDRIYAALPEARDASDPEISFKSGIKPKSTYGSEKLAIIPESDIAAIGEMEKFSFQGILVAVEKILMNDEVQCRRLSTIRCVELKPNSPERSKVESLLNSILLHEELARKDNPYIKATIQEETDWLIG